MERPKKVKRLQLNYVRHRPITKRKEKENLPLNCGHTATPKNVAAQRK
jgi:hypothetical protein